MRLMTITLLVLFILCIIGMFGCMDMPKPEPMKWKSGDMVQVIISGDRAMVIDVFEQSRYYRVRLAPSSQMTDSRLFSDDTKIERLPLILFHDFELTDVPKESTPIVNVPKERVVGV